MVKSGAMAGTVLNDAANQAKATFELTKNLAEGKPAGEGTNWKTTTRSCVLPTWAWIKTTCPNSSNSTSRARRSLALFQPDVMADMTTRQQSEWLLEMIDVSKSFPGVKALDNVNLRVRPHSVHALMGENGRKSTLLKCLFGIYEKDQGKIFFKGEEVNFTSSKEALENGVSMVHQS